MPLPINRKAARGSKYAKKIDPITFHVAYEGIEAEKEYFEALSRSISRRFRKLILFIPVPKSSTDSAPSKVVEDLVKHLDENSINLKNANFNHKGVIVIDTDHHFSDTHNKSTQEALKICRQKGIQVVITNPCFELWLMCHFSDISERSNEFCESLLRNNKHPDSKTKTFSKVEYSKMKGNTSITEIITLLPDALKNEQSLNLKCANQTLIPPTQLYSGVGQIIHQMIEAGFILND
ncbi:RloB domain-containing protein [Vibrio cholerae]|uniref:RloB family protein n=1 Tax=Vibrio cholerae TaxID=666 RepID=UPI000BA9445A|nr:RloB family protein [Vibrio cholerae]PAR91846.1 hypothetical protein CGT82_18335 [Vibrio cholerae]